MAVAILPDYIINNITNSLLRHVPQLIKIKKHSQTFNQNNINIQSNNTRAFTTFRSRISMIKLLKSTPFKKIPKPNSDSKTHRQFKLLILRVAFNFTANKSIQ